LSAGGDRDSAIVYSNLAAAYQKKGNFPEAARHYRKALAIDVSIHGERHPDVAEDLVNLGDLYLEKGDEAEALRFFARAIAANDAGPARADPDLDPPFDTVLSEEFLLKAFKGAARARARRGAKPGHPRDRAEAALVYAHAATLIDRIRAGYRAEGSKLSLVASATETYEEAIGNELELHRLTGEARHVEAAFRYAEKSKAGVLRDALNEAAARAFAGIPGALLDHERALRIDLAAADHRLAEAPLEPGGGADPLHAVREKQFAQKREYEALQRRFENEYPAYYDLKYRFETATPTEVRERALDEGTVLVEYFLGRERIFIFTVTGQDLEVTSVAREASLEADFQELRRAFLARDLASQARIAHRLYRLLLAPVEGRLEGRDLVVVPDGPLNTVPFEALVAREVGADPDPREIPYVVHDHAVSYAYSATLLLQGLRPRGDRPPDEFVGFAPTFGEGAASTGAPPPLPASRKEVTDVRGLFAKREGLFGGWLSGRSRIYLGGDATEARFKSAGLERYRYLHLATHGVVDEEHPGQSRLLLSPDPTSSEDGVLRLGEVYNLRLNADLVVLSACDTGRGQVARGEGIIGLTRGFLYAGTSSLLVSLWPVSDAAEATLVVDFYEELLGGRTKAQALRAAKLRTMNRNPEYANPYYWSSLVLLGQPR
jgi:CHAT domain-containing protein